MLFQKHLKKFGVEPTEEIIAKYSAYNISQWKRLELGEISREEVKVNRYQLLFDDIGVDISPKQATADYEENLAHGHYLCTVQKKCLNQFVMIMICTLFQTVQKSARRQDGNSRY